MLDVTVTSPSCIDMEMFDLWIDGYSITDARSQLMSLGCAEQFSMTHRMLETHVRDHYAQFSLLEAGLRHPDTFMQACAYHQLSIPTRRTLVLRYYSVDERLLRELAGRKLSNRTRRELSEIAERCELRLASCKRQFDNLLCVARRTEDLPGSLVGNIQSLFLLPRWLAECYAAIVFLVTNRFEVLKKNLGFITFSDLTYCAGQLMSHWSASSKDPRNDGPVGTDLDFQFFHDLRECKPLAERKELMDRHKSLVCRILCEKKATPIIVSTLDIHFKPISKAIITIACGLSQARELRDFFLDIVEKVIDPMRSLSWRASDTHQFLETYGMAAAQISPTKSTLLRPTWNRFIIPFSNCVERLYHT